MQPPSPSPRLTAGQKRALLAIGARAGEFHRLVGEALERLGLALPFPTHGNMLIGRNVRFASEWALTPQGARVASAMSRKAA